MKSDTPELCFKNRNDFRKWLSKNAETSGGVWLVLGKDESVPSLSAGEALEEALCFGWIDGQMKSIDSTKYLKYFSRRRAKSAWSPKNKKLIEALREKGMMTEYGEKAVMEAQKNGTWNAVKREPITEEQVEEFTKKLSRTEASRLSPAYDNFLKMAPSVKRTYTARYLSFKSEEARQRDFERIIDRLNRNLKPM